MKILSRGRSVALGLTLIAAGLAAPPALGASAAAPAARPDPTTVERIRSTADGGVALRANPATGQLGFVRTKSATGDLLPGVAASRADTVRGAIDKADAYLDRFAEGFGAPRGELVQAEVFAGQHGWSITYAQEHAGVRVFGAELKVNVDKQGQLTSVNGFVAPDADVDTTATVTEDDAAALALALVKERPEGRRLPLPDAAADDLEVRSIEKMIYRMGSTRGIQGESKLAWVAEVWNRSTVRETVIIDATTGKHLNRWSMIAHALERELIEAYDGDEAPETIWEEGDPWPQRKGRHPGELDQDHKNELLGTAESYWMFQNTFGYDAWDGEGGEMITVNNDPDINCPNANWNGVSTNYCTGVTGDDTVAHEWGHAYTESTSGLIYQWQSGAMNEAYSDIWGEVVDMLNERQNEPDGPRAPGDCSVHTPEQISISIVEPAEIAQECVAVRAAGGPDFPTTPQEVTTVVGVDEATGTGDTTTDGCSPLQNADEVDGNWVYVDENLNTACGADSLAAYYEHVEANAIDAGAVGLIVGGDPAFPPWEMPGATFTIPAAQIDGDSGSAIKSVAPAPVTLRVSQDSLNEADTYRWLSGESDPAFGGAIRDMWNPNCYGHPGQVSDEEYHCEESDSGGVHINSGVVNRTFAILVDGLPGVVEPIGLDKAANLFWQTQTQHLTPISGFVELADGLEASCTELTGQPINQVTLGDPQQPDGSDGAATPAQAEPITAADCAAVADAIAETQLRMDPVQCNFQPMLKQGEMSCGDGLVSDVAWSEDFEDGLEGWDTDVEFFVLQGDPEGEYVGGHVNHPWTTTTDLPPTTDLPGEDAGTHEPSTVAYAADPTTGACDLGPTDESSRDGLISPAITVPEGFQPRMSFEHLVATEATWDGGNVKYSTDGGETFEEIPASAWIFNGPEGELEPIWVGEGEDAELNNTNPMGGQKAFTGTDGGEVTGSWGTSYVSLSQLGLIAGDEVQFRFDLGRDGCNGVDGWYVDNVQVTVCEEKAEPPAALDTDTVVKRVWPNPVEKGKAFKVKVKVTADEIPAGVVKIKKGKAVIARSELDDRGVVVLTVKRVLGIGRHRLTAAYVGNRRFEPSQAGFRIRVVR